MWGYFPLDPPFLLSFQDLSANGGLEPVDTCGFGSLVRPPHPHPRAETFPPSLFLWVFVQTWRRGCGGLPSSPPFPAPSLKGRERRGRASKHSETGAGSRACQHPGVGAFQSKGLLSSPLAYMSACFCSEGESVYACTLSCRQLGRASPFPSEAWVCTRWWGVEKVHFVSW